MARHEFCGYTTATFLCEKSRHESFSVKNDVTREKTFLRWEFVTSGAGCAGRGLVLGLKCWISDIPMCHPKEKLLLSHHGLQIGDDLLSLTFTSVHAPHSPPAFRLRAIICWPKTLLTLLLDHVAAADR